MIIRVAATAVVIMVVVKEEERAAAAARRRRSKNEHYYFSLNKSELITYEYTYVLHNCLRIKIFTDWAGGPLELDNEDDDEDLI